jgi:hypothetical protein
MRIRKGKVLTFAILHSVVTGKHRFTPTRVFHRLRKVYERAEPSCCNGPGQKRNEDGGTHSFDQKRASEMGGYTMKLPIAQLIRTSQPIEPPPTLAFIVYIRNRASQVSKLETQFGK